MECWTPILHSVTMLGFFLFAVLSVAMLTVVVRLTGLGVRQELPRRNELLLTGLFVTVVLVAWWFLTRGERFEDRLINVTILPSPVEMVKAFVPLHLDQALVRNALTSIARIGLGFTLAVIMTVPLGVYMATFPPIAAFFRPVTLVGSYVPTVVFIPLSIAWFGATEIQKIAFLFIVYFVALLPLVIKTVADVPVAYLDVAVTKGASQWQLVRHVLFPVAKADIWDHLRGAYGVGWTWIILAEVWANAENGLGYLLEISYRRGRMDRYFAVVLVIVTIAVAFDQLWRLGSRLHRTTPKRVPRMLCPNWCALTRSPSPSVSDRKRAWLFRTYHSSYTICRTKASWWPWSARPVAASPPCCGSSPDFDHTIRPRVARPESSAKQSRNPVPNAAWWIRSIL